MACTNCVCSGGLYELQMPSRDCTPRALPRASRSGRHVGLRPPRNDNSGGHTIFTMACTGREYGAGSGMPLPYNGGCGRRECTEICEYPWRSLSAATDTIGTHHFNGGLYELQMPSRDCHVGLRPPRNDKSEGHCGRRCYSATCQPARRSLSAATFFSRAAALCSERRCRPRRGRFPLYRRPVRVGSIAPGPAVRSPAMITPSGPPA